MPLSLSADNKQNKTARQRFAHPLTVIIIVTGFILLLFFLYPKQALHQQLAGNSERTAAGRTYLAAILLKHPGDHQVRLTLAQTWLSDGCYRKALAELAAFPAELPPDIHKQVEHLRYRALRDMLLLDYDEDDTSGQSANRKDMEAFAAQAKHLMSVDNDFYTIRLIEYDARLLKLSELSEEARKKLYRIPVPKNMDSATGGSTVSATPVQYREDAARLFAEMKKTGSLAERRSLFIKALKTLQAGNLVHDAFREGEKHLPMLASDRESLVFMTKISLAAGKPEKAQEYVRRALGMEMAK